MLEVLPIQAKIEQEAICARCGVEYDADCMAFPATLWTDMDFCCMMNVRLSADFCLMMNILTDEAQERER